MSAEETEQPSDDSRADAAKIEVPETVQEEARGIVCGAFRLFADHNRRLADDLAEFNGTRKKVREEVSRGARRTTGRIV